MTPTDQPQQNFGIKAAFLAGLCALALLVAQNASLNNQVSQLQNELNRNLHEVNNNHRLRKLSDVNIRGDSIPRPAEPLESLETGSVDDEEATLSPRKKGTFGSGKSGKARSSFDTVPTGGSGKSGKSKKSSKKAGSADCGGGVVGSGDVTAEEKCEDLRELVFELSTEIEDLEAETLRYAVLADELEQTAILVGAEETEQEGRIRKLANGTGYNDKLADSLRMLQNQEELLKNGNERVTQLNDNLRAGALDWISLNANLTEENLALLQNITGLTQENFELLNEQWRLSDQIKDLNSTLDQYKDLLDQHADLNDQLDQSTGELQAEIDRLAAENEEYKRLNGELSDSIDDLKEQTSELQKQNEILAGLNDDLNATTIKLNNTIDELEDQVDRLTEQNGVLSSEIDRLSNETDRLELVNGQLEQNIVNLTAEVDRFANKTDELKKLNDELQNIVSFVNETGQFLDQNLEEVTEYLSNQIVAYRSVATETLQNTFIQRAALWDCAYRDHFGDEQFSKDHKLPIPPSKFEDVLDYVDDRVLQELCLDLEDFEIFVNAKFDKPVWTTDHLVAGIASYTNLAFDYYFPDSGESGGLAEEDWALVGYNCERLSADKKFLHDPNAI